jgi:large subunit ribosomal protein L14
MIYPQTMLTVADNTGAKKVMCIRIRWKQNAEIGDTIIAVVKEATPICLLNVLDIIRAIVRTKKLFVDKMECIFDLMIMRLCCKYNNPRGTRVFGPVAREIREIFSKIISTGGFINKKKKMPCQNR